MPLYRIEVKYAKGGEETGNRYYVSADSLGAAALHGEGIIAAFQPLLSSKATILRMRVSTAAADGRTGMTLIKNLPGLRTIGNLMPDHDVVRCDFTAGQGNDLNRKYLHWCLDVNDTQDGRLLEPILTAMADYCEQLCGLTVPVYSAKGQAWTGGYPFNQVRYHQLDRAFGDRTPKEGQSAG